MMRNPGLMMIEKGRVAIVDAPLPEPGADEVLVRGRACGVCRYDINLFTGKSPEPLPHVLGHEGVGIVEAVGANVTHVKPGEKVTAIPEYRFSSDSPWMMATFFVAPANRTGRIPDDVTDFQYWISEPATCAVSGMRISRVGHGDTVVVNGCAYMGLLLMQVLPARLTKLTVAIDIIDDHLELARQMGADVVLNAHKVDVVQEVLSLTGGRGADVVIEASGAPGTIEVTTGMTRMAGRLSIFGMHVGNTVIDTGVWHMQGLEVLNPSPMMSPDIVHEFWAAVALMNKGTIDQRKLITHTARWDDVDGITRIFELGARHAPDYIKGAILFD
jgi:threonine dehydrogenase-like Zn-dependent dehydrogenase